MVSISNGSLLTAVTGNIVSLFIVNDGEHFTVQSNSDGVQWLEYGHQHSHRQAWVGRIFSWILCISYAILVHGLNQRPNEHGHII